MKICFGYVDKRWNYCEFLIYSSLILVMMRKVKMFWFFCEDMLLYYDNIFKSVFD